jgi:hypothetical protein
MSKALTTEDTEVTEEFSDEKRKTAASYPAR